MLAEHGKMARGYPDVRANTVASFALGDYEWMLAFEADELHRIVDLMRDLRASTARRHVREEVPFYTGKRTELGELVANLAEPVHRKAFPALVRQQRAAVRRVLRRCSATSRRTSSRWRATRTTSASNAATPRSASRTPAGPRPSSGITVGAAPRFELFVYVDDVEAEVESFRAAGHTVLQEPATMPWGPTPRPTSPTPRAIRSPSPRRSRRLRSPASGRR